MSKKITIAIDGFSSTGKSTLAKELAKKLSYIYVDTGAMYRAITLYALQNNLISATFFNKEKLVEALPEIQLNFQFDPQLGFAAMYLNNNNVESTIRSLEVSGFVSQIAALSAVRKKLVQQQQQMGKNKGIVMDGRDIGTVVFPDAELKIFMTADAATRAQRRFNELQQKGEPATYEQVLQNVIDRDNMDTQREDSPLTKAPDAIEIDNSYLSKKEQFDAVMEQVAEIVKQT